MNQQLESKNIKVASIEQKTLANGSVMTKIKDEEGTKYSFFNTKKDGSETAASQGFAGVRIGDVVEIAYAEDERAFIGDEGKEIKYTQRTIRTLEKVQPHSQYNENGTLKPGVAKGLDNQGNIVIDEEAPF